MSIVGGLHHAEAWSHDRAAAGRNALAEWALRNAWVIMLAGGVAFWAVVAGLLAFA